MDTEFMKASETPVTSHIPNHISSVENSVIITVCGSEF